MYHAMFFFVAKTRICIMYCDRTGLFRICIMDMYPGVTVFLAIKYWDGTNKISN
jgi:hypothetical protein